MLCANFSVSGPLKRGTIGREGSLEEEVKPELCLCLEGWVDLGSGRRDGRTFWSRGAI